MRESRPLRWSSLRGGGVRETLGVCSLPAPTNCFVPGKGFRMDLNGRRRVYLGLALAAISILVFALPALAANSRTDTNNGNTITVTIGNSGNTFTCSGTNRRSTGQAVPFILVSAVCQYRDTAGGWHDFETAPANSATNAATVSVSYTDNPCIGSDGGANLAAGNWKIRGQADGRYEDPLGTNHPYNGDGGALETTSPFPQASCTS